MYITAKFMYFSILLIYIYWYSFNEVHERILKLNGLFGIAKNSNEWYGINNVEEVSI